MPSKRFYRSPPASPTRPAAAAVPAAPASASSGRLTIRNALIAAAAVRAALLCFGLWQDANMPVRYTDIDYIVFTDAARFMYDGGSPFERATYRYTPFLAWMLQPNIWLHPAWGKLLFVLADLVVGWIIYTDGRSRGLTESRAVMYASAWLFNPISINVSTRGNAEAVLSVLIVGWMHLLMRRQTIPAAVLYGLSVHFKLYPIIYAPAIALFINHRYSGTPHRPWYRPAELFNTQRINFTLLSAASFAAPTVYLLRGICIHNKSRNFHLILSLSCAYIFPGVDTTMHYTDGRSSGRRTCTTLRGQTTATISPRTSTCFTCSRSTRLRSGWRRCSPSSRCFCGSRFHTTRTCRTA